MIRIFLILVVLSLLVTPAVAQQQPPPPPQEQERTPFSVSVLPQFAVQAQRAAEADDLDQAIVSLSAFILFNPTIGENYFQRSLLFTRRGDIDLALQDTEQALNLLPEADQQTRMQVRSHRVTLHLQQENVDRAIDELTILIDEAPSMGEAYLDRGSLYLQRGRVEDALADFEAAEETLSETTAEQAQALYFRQANAYLQLDQPAGALDALDTLIARFPDLFEAYAARAQVLVELERYDDAIATYTDALEMDMEAVQLYLGRGLANNAAGNTSAAADDYILWIGSITQQPVEGGELLSGEPVELSMQTGVTFILPFIGEADQTLSVDARGLAEDGIDPLLVVLDAENNPLVADDDSGDGLDAAIRDFVLPESGVYVVLVGHARGGGDGDVQVELFLDPQ